ncbi:hypothetical protein Efla_002995 [Eimeria flavescens]
MNLYPSGGAPSQRGPYATRPPSLPLAEAASAGYPQGYVGAPGSAAGGAPAAARGPASWSSSSSMDYPPRGSLGGAPPMAGGGPPGYAPGAPQAGVWSSPFGFSGEPGGEGGTGAPQGAPQSESRPEQQVMNMVLHSVADNLTAQAGKQVSLLQQRFPRFLLSLKPYFSVSQAYVCMRLGQLLFPFAALLSSSSSPRAYTAASDISNAAAAAHTPERDMYLPLMALTTFVLLVCIQTGTQGGFYPELLGSTLSVSLLLLLGEVGALKLVLYITGACPAAALDLLCFCGYKFVHVTLLLLLRLGLDLLGGPPIAWWGPPPSASSEAAAAAAPPLDDPQAAAAAAAAGGREGGWGGGEGQRKQRGGGPHVFFVCSFVYLSACAAAELLLLLRRARAADKDASSAPYEAHAAAAGRGRGHGASYVLLVAALLQIPLCWFLLPCKFLSMHRGQSKEN